MRARPFSVIARTCALGERPSMRLKQRESWNSEEYPRRAAVSLTERRSCTRSRLAASSFRRMIDR